MLIDNFQKKKQIKKEIMQKLTNFVSVFLKAEILSYINLKISESNLVSTIIKISKKDITKKENYHDKENS